MHQMQLAWKRLSASLWKAWAAGQGTLIYTLTRFSKRKDSTPTILHMFSKRKDSGFPYGCADAAAADRRRGSNVYEVNLWLWSFARGKPSLGGLSVEKTFERQVAAGEASKECAAENCRRRKADKA